MSTQDKVSGRLKKAAGGLLGDRSLRRQGIKEERKAEAKEQLARHEEEVDERAAEVAELERRTAKPR